MARPYKQRAVKSLADRLWAKVDKDGPLSAGVGGRCWLWSGATVGRGYGNLGRGRREGNILAHRAAYELANGPIPEGLTVDHLCNIPRCVNPAHMVLATRGENAMRGEGPAAKQARQTHCSHGHEFTPENTRLARGKRRCRACQQRENKGRTERRRVAVGERLCQTCGKPLPPDAHGLRKYCDDRCAALRTGQ